MTRNYDPFFVFATLFFILLTACSSQTAPTPLEEPIIPTTAPLQENENGLENPTAVPEQAAPEESEPATPIPEPTAAPIEEPQPEEEPTAPPIQIEPDLSYQVIFVESNDTLNVRSGAGVNNDIVGTFSFDADNIQITGSGVEVSGSTWVPVTNGQVSGWINSRFLTTAVNTSFCTSHPSANLLTEFEQAIATKDNGRLAQLIHPERGLRIRTAWWNPEVRFEGNGRQNLFTSNSATDWGTTIGEGAPILGSFNNIITPLLEETILGASQTACQEILHGGTPGLIILPEGYQQHSFISYYREGAKEYNGLDWGTWAVGIEEWQGEFYISFLVYYQWET